eukprot:6099161-Prymnesium_polylepis.1
MRRYREHRNGRGCPQEVPAEGMRRPPVVRPHSPSRHDPARRATGSDPATRPARCYLRGGAFVRQPLAGA